MARDFLNDYLFIKVGRVGSAFGPKKRLRSALEGSGTAKCSRILNTLSGPNDRSKKENRLGMPSNLLAMASKKDSSV